jgi:uncharacterized linocin/CFP29 family protein
VVDFEGPGGWETAAVNLGRLDRLAEPPEGGAELSLRRVQPLAEVRIPFKLSIEELDAVARGCRDPDLDPVVEAAESAARVENTAIFKGSPGLGIAGVLEASAHPGCSLPETPVEYPGAVAEASEQLRQVGIDGPYGLALGSRAYNQVAQASEDGYPIRQRVTQVIDGPMVWVPDLDGAVLLSLRGGDFVLTVGQDLSVGYLSHDREEVELFLTESFTFQVLEGDAAVCLDHE